MGGEGSTRCILCGGSVLTRIFSHENRTYSEVSGGPNRRIGVEIRHVMRCNGCGLVTRMDEVTRNLKSRRESRYSPLLSDAEFNDGIAAIPPDTRFSPHTGLEEIEEIALFRSPPGALLNVGIDGFDIIETARLYGWRSSSENGWYETPVEQSETAGAGCCAEREFDVVRLQGSLERADDPFAFLEKMSGILRRNGLLVVSLPDFSGWDYPLYGEGPALWPVNPPRWFFTPQTLERILAAGGYTPLKITAFCATSRLPAGVDLLQDQAAPLCWNSDGLSTSGQRVPYFRVIATRTEKKTAVSLRFAARQSHSTRECQRLHALL